MRKNLALSINNLSPNRLAQKSFIWFSVFAIQLVIAFDVFGASVTVTPTETTLGGNITTTWSGFSGILNIEVWKGNINWVDANISAPSSGSQILNTTGWEVRGDYRVKIYPKLDIGNYVFSPTFGVHNPSTSISSTSTTVGGTITSTWSGFSSNVNIEVWKGGGYWTEASTTSSGSGSHLLNTTNWAYRSDYSVKIILKNDISIYIFSPYFAVTAPPTPPKPTLTGPSNYSVIKNQSPFLRFTWNQVSPVTNYHIYVSTNSGLGDPKVVNESLPGNFWYWDLDRALSNGVYYWSVDAENSGSFSGISGNIRTFILDTPLGAPTITSPPASPTPIYTENTTTSFSWSAPSGGAVERYNIRLVSGSNINVGSSLVGSPSNGLEPVTSPYNLNLNFGIGTYTLGVRAMKQMPPVGGYNQSTYESAIGWGPYDTVTFQVEAATPPKPTLTGPSQYSVFKNVSPSVTFTWNQVSPVTNYHIYVSTNAGLGEPKVVNEPLSVNFWDLDRTLSNGVYYWSVDAENSGSFSEITGNIRTFILDTPLGTPTITSPAASPTPTYTENTTTPFTWSAPSGGAVERYNVRVVSGTDLDEPSLIGDDPAMGLEPASTPLDVTLNYPPGIYTFGVRAMKQMPPGLGYSQVTYESAVGWGEYDEITFQVEAAVPSGTTLVAPPNTLSPAITNHRVQFIWDPFPSATAYHLLVDNNAGFGSPEIDINSLTNTQYPDAAPIVNHFGRNQYYWRVGALVGGNWIWSDDWTFAYEPTEVPNPVYVPVHRTYLPGAKQDHYYHTQEDKIQTAIDVDNYEYERIECYISWTKFVGSVPLFVMYEPIEKTHYYTIDETEKDNRINPVTGGYEYQGILGYVYASYVPGTVKLSGLHQPSPHQYLYSIRKSEYEAVLNEPAWNFSPEGDAGYVSPNGVIHPLAQSCEQGNFAGVDAGTGAFRLPYSQHGLSFHGFGPAFQFTIHYNSQNPYYPQSNIPEPINALFAPVGTGWDHSFNAFVLESPQGEVVMRWGRGSENFFVHVGASSYDTVDGEFHILKRTGTGYELTKKNQTRFVFGEYEIPTEYGGVVSVFILDSVIDRHGNTITLTRQTTLDPHPGRLTTATDAAGRNLAFAYDSSTGRLVSVTDTVLVPNRTLGFTYDTDGKLIELTNARNETTVFNYNLDNLLESVALPRDNVHEIEYTSDRVTGRSVGSPLTPIAYDFDYDSLPGTTFVNRQGSTIARYVREPATCQVTEIHNSQGKIVDITYDTTHTRLPSDMIDAEGNLTHFDYDARGNVTRVTNAETNEAIFEYDALNNLISRTEFAPAGDPTPPKTLFDWSGSVNLLQITNALGHVTRFEDHVLGQPGRIIDPRNRTTWLTYDPEHNLSTITDPENNLTRYGYDLIGRMTSVEDALNKVTTYEYDANDNLTRVRDADLHETVLRYDENDNLDRVSYVRDGVSDVIQYLYDPDFDRITSVLDPYNVSHVYEYDSVTGDMIQRTDGEGRITEYQYNDDHWLEKIIYQGTGRQVTFGYDKNGNRKSMDESWLGGSHIFDYDLLNRLELHTDTFGQTVQFNYDDAGNRLNTIYPGAKTVSYGHDALNRLETVTDWVAGSPHRYRYDSDFEGSDNLTGLLTRLENPNGTATNYGYDQAARLTDIVHRKSTNSIFASYAFAFNPVGSPISVVTVDPIEPQLLASNVSSSIIRDNRLQSDSDGVTYGYDDNGNRTSKTDNGVVTTYTYDFENRLTHVNNPSGAVEYIYDGLGNRIAKIENGVTTRYVLDLAGPMSHVLMETDGSNTPKAHYVHGQGLLSQITPANARYAYHADQVGSIVAMTDSSESMVNRYAYSPFGIVLAADESGPANPFQFVGQFGVMKESNDLNFMRARFYDEGAGRFLNKDPIGFDGGDWNLYAYAGNSPSTFIDPSGEFVSALAGIYAVYKSTKIVINTAYILDRIVLHTDKITWAYGQRKRYARGSKNYIALDNYIEKEASELFSFLLKESIKSGIEFALSKVPDKAFEFIYEGTKALAVLGEAQNDVDQRLREKISEKARSSR